MKTPLLRLFIPLLLATPFFSAHSEENRESTLCRNSGQINLYRPENVPFTDLSRHLAAKAIETDLKGFCEWNRMDRAIDTIQYGARLYGKSGSEILAEYRQLKLSGDLIGAIKLLEPYSYELFFDPWDRSLLGPAKLKKTRINTHFAKIKFETKNSDVLSSFAIGMQAALKNDFPQTMEIPKYRSVQNAPRQTAAKQLAACAYLSFRDSLSCNTSLSALYDHADIYAPFDTTALGRTTALSLVKSSLANERLTKGLQAAALNLWKKIETNSFELYDNIFDDLKSALVSHGLSEEEAADEALQALGVIATGGPNFATRGQVEQVRSFPGCEARANKIGCNPNYIFLAAIAEGLAHADMLKMEDAKKPSLYSLPKGYDFPCDAGKPYHFWMAAALTRDLQKKGNPTGGARAAVYLTQMAYQASRPYDDKSDALLNRPRFGTIENSNRIDLVLAAAGTRFGGDVGERKSSKPVSLQEALRQNVLAGGTRPNSASAPLFLMEEQPVLQWAEDLAPKHAFSYFND